MLKIEPSRRQALLGIAAVSLQGFVPLAMAPALAETAPTFDTVDAYVDILLPADGLSPAASALGVGASIMALGAEQPLLADLIDLVTAWMDTIGADRFVDLSFDERHAIVTYMANADIDTLEGRFFQLIRLFAIEFYYAQPQALAGMALDPAPQPSGYPPPWG